MRENAVYQFIWEELRDNYSLGSAEMTRLERLFGVQPYNTLSYLMPIRELALYLIERIYYLPKLSPVLYLRSTLFKELQSKFPNMSDLTYEELDEIIDHALYNLIQEEPYRGQFPDLFTHITIFMHFFLQLANLTRRFAEITYVFTYVRTQKIETLLKLVKRVNFTITKKIDGVDYIQLVFDTVRRENILQQLPYQLLQPEMAMLITDEPRKEDLLHQDFNPAYLLVVGKPDEFHPSGTRTGYFLHYDDRAFSYRFETRTDTPLRFSNFS
ncbi:MAG: hypothetical protein ACXAE3_15405, partial [Candidatus Kariarchaeaceae archaeon]